MNAFELDLRGCKLRLQQLAHGIHTGLRALLLNIDEPPGKLLLLANVVKFLGNSVKFDVCSRSVERNLFTGILKPRLRSQESEPRRINVTLLRNTVDQRLHGRIPD